MMKEVLIGLAPRWSRPGDKIFILRGGKVPVILRGAKGDGLYQFIGEAYVHGAMYGHMFNLTRCENLLIPRLSFLCTAMTASSLQADQYQCPKTAKPSEGFDSGCVRPRTKNHHNSSPACYSCKKVPGSGGGWIGFETLVISGRAAFGSSDAGWRRSYFFCSECCLYVCTQSQHCLARSNRHGTPWV
jgi:hypothetical protein